MATKTFYWFPDQAAGTSAHGSLQEGTAPGAADSNSQFNNGTVAAGTYAKYFRDSVRPQSSFSTTVEPDGNIDNSHGDCLRTQNPYTGSFDGSNWSLTFGIRVNVAHAGSAAEYWLRVFRSRDPAGLNATEITSSPIGSGAFNGSSTLVQTATVTWTPGAFSLNGEYLFFELALEITGPSTNITNTWIIQNGSGISQIVTANFGDDPATYLDQRQHLSKKKRYRKKRGPKKRSRWHPPDGVVIVQPFPFWNRKKKWPRKKPPKKKRRDRLEYIAITIATTPPGFPFKPRRKVPRNKNAFAGGRRKRLRQWQNAPLPHLQFQPALCGHAAILPLLAARTLLLERDSAKSAILEQMTATAHVFESRSAVGKVLETMTATATLICCK